MATTKQMQTSGDTKAEEFVRSVLRDTFHQKVSDSKVRSLAIKIEKVTAPEAPAERKRA